MFSGDDTVQKGGRSNAVCPWEEVVLVADLVFSVPGDPCGQGRPLFSTKDNITRAIDRPKSRNYKAFVKEIAAGAIRKCGWMYTELPIYVEICAFMAVPSSYSKKRKNECYTWQEHPCKKPDIDNIFKIITDALSGIAYKDDKQITDVHMFKRYVSSPTDGPSVRITVRLAPMEKGR